MMYYKNLIGRRFGKWTVLSVFSHGTDEKTRMLCRCDCGTVKDVDAYHLTHGGSLSCGKCKRIVTEGDYRRCYMKDGTSFIFDAEDEPIVRAHSWAISSGHVKTTIDRKSVFFHRLIMGNPEGAEIDHVNGDMLDNRRKNLRIATHAQNNQNKGLRKDSTTGYKGVCFDKRSGRYIAYINANGQRTYLGYFDNKVDAAKAYDQAALQLHGEFAKLNIA